MHIEVVEPTLEGEAGHCRSFLLSLCGAGRGREVAFRVYGGKRASLPGAEGARCEVVPFFSRRLRRLQAFILYRRLLRGGGRIFVSTAGRTDMVLLDLAAKGEIPPGKVFLYFHWLRPSPRKMAYFRRFAVSHPGVTVLGPTNAVIGPFRECGFRDARVVPYPITPSGPDKERSEDRFRHILFAGAARRDKGFSRVVDLVCDMAAQGMAIPFSIQASPDHYEKYGEGIPDDLDRLRKAIPSWLHTIPGYPWRGRVQEDVRRGDRAPAVREGGFRGPGQRRHAGCILGGGACHRHGGDLDGAGRMPFRRRGGGRGSFSPRAPLRRGHDPGRLLPIPPERAGSREDAPGGAQRAAPPRGPRVMTAGGGQ